MTASAKTLRAIERAVMRWYRQHRAQESDALEGTFATEIVAIHRAAGRHAAALKRKRTVKKARPDGR